MVEYVDGIEKSKIENMDALRSKYPFLEQIIAQQTYDLFNIEEAVVDESVLEGKCYNHGSEGPEAFDEQIYSFSKGEVRELAVLINPYTKDKIVRRPSPSVREELTSQEITPDFLVKSRCLKYEINGEHHHDFSLIIYKS
ncbi:MAG: hypothetical protein KJ583_04480 [Nanoarchaeota archaeon]|nr:hypothetical protein [Nanoarchaeota archaeon]MBU1270105.1 hypothetical protein [Nanoarchaeota archaeon]MBU1604548.1 hypothetical protein [Nanoarchaeota archaeon]MBU2459191.1 hypothetical protein [Nanoarchaeota archaeon]